MRLSHCLLFSAISLQGERHEKFLAQKVRTNFPLWSRGTLIKVMTSRLGGGQPAVKTFYVTYPDRAWAQEAVKRHCGSDYYEIVAVEELVATDLGPNKVRAR